MSARAAAAPAPVTTRRPSRRSTAQRVGLQVVGLSAVAACAFVFVSGPNTVASATQFQGTFADYTPDGQVIAVDSAAGASVSRDAYSVVAPPPPPPVVASTPTTGSSSGSASSDSSCPTPDVTADPEGAKAIALELAAARGWTGAQYDALVALWSRESGWRLNALNKSSCAYGIPQALPGSKMASAGADWQTNPATQITWGLNYIAGAYGDPISALAHSDASGWY
ncbi:hypothetical protein B5808_06180 [Cnuibacter physcomitrellae]|uniref:Transglycosylase SLT domain-containing protein n=1 Tax=Cnuibacter physcomitrellae TaxID=1619308 RepID=A0A1X9LK51_9MICO|nr:hypothetical protein B5808_06180 [Cnuibacter physcomitrellae]